MVRRQAPLVGCADQGDPADLGRYLRCERGAAVRLVGRRAVARRLRAVRAAAQPRGARTAGRAACRASTSGSGPASCSPRCARPAPTWSASTGGCRWTRPRAGSARARSCRATSTRRCCWPTGRCIETEVRRIVAEGRAAAGHIFNLGHGVLPDTDPDVLTRIVELVHSLRDRATSPSSAAGSPGWPPPGRCAGAGADVRRARGGAARSAASCRSRPVGRRAGRRRRRGDAGPPPGGRRR